MREFRPDLKGIATLIDENGKFIIFYERIQTRFKGDCDVTLMAESHCWATAREFRPDLKGIATS